MRRIRQIISAKLAANSTDILRTPYIGLMVFSMNTISSAVSEYFS